MLQPEFSILSTLWTVPEAQRALLFVLSSSGQRGEAWVDGEGRHSDLR